MKHFMKLIKLFALLVVFFTMAGIFIGSGTMEAQKEVDTKNGLEITFLVFSGRENPTFVISDEGTLKQLEELVNNLKVDDLFSKETVIPSILGYNGIMVKPIGEPGIFIDVKALAIFNGYVEKQTIDTASKSGFVATFLIDNSSTVEDFLLNLALSNGAIDQKIYDFIKK
jgi:stage V sporulation protein SpoVS